MDDGSIHRVWLQYPDMELPAEGLYRFMGGEGWVQTWGRDRWVALREEPDGTRIVGARVSFVPQLDEAETSEERRLVDALTGHPRDPAALAAYFGATSYSVRELPPKVEAAIDEATGHPERAIVRNGPPQRPDPGAVE